MVFLSRITNRKTARAPSARHGNRYEKVQDTKTTRRKGSRYWPGGASGKVRAKKNNQKSLEKSFILSFLVPPWGTALSADIIFWSLGRTGLCLWALSPKRALENIRRPGVRSLLFDRRFCRYAGARRKYCCDTSVICRVLQTCATKGREGAAVLESDDPRSWHLFGHRRVVFLRKQRRTRQIRCCLAGERIVLLTRTSRVRFAVSSHNEGFEKRLWKGSFRSCFFTRFFGVPSICRFLCGRRSTFFYHGS